MLRRFHIIAIILIVLPALVSCRAISSFLGNGEVVAQVGSEKLYKSDVDALIPKGMAPEDSVLLVNRYINSWAADRVYLKIAEEQLSKSEQDVTKELEDYRKSLLKYRYEQLYVNERLDTAVSMDHIEEYYRAHQDKFVLDRPVVKARFLNIAGDSPVLKQIRKRMSSSDANELVEADSLAFSSAVKFTTWSDSWIDIAVIAREYSVDYSVLSVGRLRDGIRAAKPADLWSAAMRGRLHLQRHGQYQDHECRRAPERDRIVQRKDHAKAAAGL